MRHRGRLSKPHPGTRGPQKPVDSFILFEHRTERNAYDPDLGFVAVDCAAPADTTRLVDQASSLPESEATRCGWPIPLWQCQLAPDQ